MDRTNQILRQRNIALEVELDEIKSKFEQKDKSIALIEDALEEKQKELYRFKNLDKIEMQNLDRISNLEGEIKFKETEIDELTEQIAFDRKRNQQQISQLQDQLEEYKERYNQAYQAQVELQMLKPKYEEAVKLKEKYKELEQDLMASRAQIKSITSENMKMKQVEEQIDFFKN